MLIRCKLIRAGGSQITLGKGKDERLYHFKPFDPKKPGEDHVCDVADQKDIATFLAISEGYEIHPAEIASRVVPTKGSAPTPAKTTTATEPGAPAQKGGEASAPKALSKEELIAAVTKKTGKKPHLSTSVKKLEALLAE